MIEQFVELPYLVQLLHPLRYCLGQEAGKLDPDHEEGIRWRKNRRKVK
jgi:hypothetical protein